MSDVKQVKVDNWGIYFLQRLKHFFNRTDYCDLTLQFQDNAQLKVHRLVLSACTEYFELLERTCEMYEDCLVMPDDLQADVVVPIVNFMYTGHLKFRMDLLERLYQTSQILNMPVLTKLLESHRMSMKAGVVSARQDDVTYSAVKRTKTSETKIVKPTTSNKRSYKAAFDNNNVVHKEKTIFNTLKASESINSPGVYSPEPKSVEFASYAPKKSILIDPRPTRYELPEELDVDYDNSFCNISYTCKPLMVHPDNVKHYSAKRSGIFSDGTSSKKLLPGTSTVDIVQCTRLPRDDNIFEDSVPDHNMHDDLDLFNPTYTNEPTKNSNQLFDQILDDGPKVTIETKDSKTASNLDHAKIISEVLKKYPHLVKSNKNIKLKILNTPGKGKKQTKASTFAKENDKKPKLKTDEPDYTYETDVIDSKQAAILIAMGAENTKGPWICLICGTPGKALHFTSYYKFRRHLVEVHHEKPVANICEYCGLRALKRNYLLHHLYSQHGVEPPPQYHFPKCNRCNYIALTEGLLVKHKMTHSNVKMFRCNVCSVPFDTTKQLLHHIQVTGHKYSAEKKTNFQCIYCFKSFLRDTNLYAHLKTYHKKEAKSDSIIEDSDEEKPVEEVSRIKPDRENSHHIKFEPSTSYENVYEVDVQYQIQQRPDSMSIQVTPKKQHNAIINSRQKILNPGFSTPAQKEKPVRKSAPEPSSNFLEDMNIPSPSQSMNHNEEEIVLIDNTEYIMRDNQLIPKRHNSGDFIIPDIMDPSSLEAVQPTTSIDYTEVNNTKILGTSPSSIVLKKTTNINQPIQIVVSNEEEYKALMASNHPILFDNGDANKTLTVLTGAHNATMESTTLDLENAQSNDMMIIQEDYPLNVTEAVPTNNSNIVVVYSHPVDDQNKQFQILTTGGIGSQFVQSSAIITQNYETVTTTAPVMSAHVLEPQPDTTWQDTVQTAEIQQITVDQATANVIVDGVQLQNVVENVAIKPIENETNDFSELPEVHLASEAQDVVQDENQENVNTNDLNVIPSDHVNETVENIQETVHNISDIQMDTNILSENVVEEETAAIIEPIQIAESNIVPETTPEVLPSEVNQEITVEEPMETESLVEETSSTIVSQEQPADVLTQVEDSQVTENDDPNINPEAEHQEPLPESQVYDDIVTINHEPNEINSNSHADTSTLPKETDEKIQNLTSEWSEDEYDVPENEAAATDNVQEPEEVPTPVLQPDDEEKLEETIENIQNEVQNHVNSVAAALATTVPPEPEIETESQVKTPEDPLTGPQDPLLLPAAVHTVNDPQAQQKISSLLNDWEDNDSQEERPENDISTEENKEGDKIEETVGDENPKTDNIKNLVSDWDEDDEEVKND